MSDSSLFWTAVILNRVNSGFMPNSCPLCGGEIEIGCLLGKDTLFGFQWYAGDPTLWKNMIPHGDSVGRYDLFSGTHMTGFRCQSCRKIVLDY
jgi:hypothetical protein